MNLEFARIDFRAREAIEARVFEIDDASAAQANKMVVLACFGIEARGRSLVARPRHEAEGNKTAKNTMDGHARDLRQFTADFAVKLLRGGVVGAIHDGVENSAALSRDGEAVFAMDGDETVQSLFFLSEAHAKR